jgi:hypothetical protein
MPSLETIRLEKMRLWLATPLEWDAPNVNTAIFRSATTGTLHHTHPYHFDIWTIINVDK